MYISLNETLEMGASSMMEIRYTVETLFEGTSCNTTFVFLNR